MSTKKKNQRVVYEWVNISDDLVYEWVRVFKGQASKYWLAHLYQNYPQVTSLPPPRVMCSSAAKRSINNQYVCKYIGRINDQSNWSGPFSLVVMTLDYRSRGTWFDPRSVHSTGIFSLQVYFSSYYRCTFL